MAYKGYAATITAGLGGYNGSQNYDRIPITDLLQAENIRYDGDAWRKAPGMAKFDANAVVANATCSEGIDFWYNTATQNIITAWIGSNAASNAVFKEVAGNLDSVTLLNNTSFTEPITFLECGQEWVNNPRKLLMFHKGIVPYVYDANSNANAMIAMTNVSADWTTAQYPAAAIMHDQRVVAWGAANAPHNLYFSTLNDHTDFATGLPPVYSIMPGEGEYIVACHSLVSTTRLYVFKYPTGIYYIDTADINSWILPVTTVRKDIGMAGPHAITKVGSLGTWFIGSDGHVYSLEAVQNPDIDPKDASITAQLNLSDWIRDNVNPNRLKFARIIYDPNRKEVWAMYSETGTTINGLCLVFDISKPGNVKISTDTRGNYFNAAFLHKEATTTFRQLYTGGTGGFVYKHNQPTRLLGASAYQGTFRTPDTDFSWLSANLAEVSKRFDWLEFIFQSTGDYPLYVETYIDGEYYNTYTITLGAAQTGLDAFVLDTSQLATSGLIRGKVKIGGMGKRFGVRCYNNGASQDFNIARILVYFVPLGQGGEKGE